MNPNLEIIMQIRLSSTRLPAKALLPVGGMPACVLAARRAGNTGHSVTVATSVDPTDDLLAETLREHGIRVARGSLNNVLERFLLVLRDMPDDTAVVRLTGDNLLVDGHFVELLFAEFKRTGARYLGGSGVELLLPYGMGAEIFYAGDLRKAAAQADDTMREHVTTPLRYHCAGKADRTKITDLPDLSSLSSTMDMFQDYLKIEKLFRHEADPVHLSWETLCLKLNNSQQGVRS